MKQILAFNIDKNLNNILALLNIDVINVSKDNQNQTLGYLLNNTQYSEINAINAYPFNEALIIFINFSEQDLDNIINILKVNNYSHILKAIVTDTNINWPANLLYKELTNERSAFKSNK